MSSHIFLNFIPRQDRPYHGILEELARLPRTKVQVIDLPYSLFEVTRRVEYSLRKYIRFLYYGPIYRYLEAEVDRAIAAHDGPLFIYTTDEGVWTEYIKQILRKHVARHPMLVNVQHGLHFLVRPSARSMKMRLIANRVSCQALGYPIFGLGLGGSRCDMYLVYGKAEREFLQQMGLRAVVAGALIKARFMAQVAECTPPSGPQRIALFALQPVNKECGFERDEAQFFDAIRPVAERLARKHHYTVVYRPHPGMDHIAIVASLERYGLLAHGIIQDVSKVDITLALAQSDMVLSHSSTVLMEALLADRIAVQMLEYAHSKRLHLPINFLCLDGPETLAETDLIAVQPVRMRQTPAQLGIDCWTEYLVKIGALQA